MNIISINTSDFGGGAESSAVNLSNTFRELGHRSILLVGRKRSSDTHVLEIPLYPINIIISNVFPNMNLNRLHTIRNRIERLLGLEEFFSPGSHKLLEIAPFKPDVLVFHNLHGKYFDLRSLKALSRRVPCVLILRDCWLLSGHCAYPKGCMRWKTGCGLCPDLSIYPPIRRDATAFNWKRKKHIFDRSLLYLSAPSQWQIDRVHESMLHGRKYQFIHNAIDMGLFKPGSRSDARERLSLPEKSRIVLFTAHTEFKDFETMFRAAQQVLQNKHGKEKDLLFVCLGRAGTDQCMQNGSISFPGFIRDQEQLACYYQAADLYLHAAHDETFGKSITEAMACGIPVIATKTGGIPEQITHGVNGFLVSPGDSSAMSHLIYQLLEDPEKRTRMGACAHESAQKYTFANQAAHFIEWFKEVMGDWSSLYSTQGNLHRKP